MEHRLDNWGVVQRYRRLHNDKEVRWWQDGDRDVWREIWREWRAWGDRYSVIWVEGHPEVREPDRTKWGVHEWGNHICDREAARAYGQDWQWGAKMWLGPREPGHRKELRVCVGGEEVVGDLHAGVLAQLQMQEAKRYVEDSIAGGSKLLEGLSRTLMAMRGKGSKEGMWRAARAVRFVWGWAPTYAKLHQRGVTDSDKCPLCGEHDGRGHAVRECKHKELVKVRREVTVDMLKKVAGLGTVKKKRTKGQEQGGGRETQAPASQVLPAHWIKAMHLVWGLGKEGTMRQWEGMGWPEFEAAVRHGCGAMLPGEEDKVVSCMGRIDKGTARGIVVLTVQGVGLRSGHFRESGLWSEEWQRELQRSGMKRGIVQDLVRVLHKGIARLEKEV